MHVWDKLHVVLVGSEICIKTLEEPHTCRLKSCKPYRYYKVKPAHVVTSIK